MLRYLLTVFQLVLLVLVLPLRCAAISSLKARVDDCDLVLLFVWIVVSVALKGLNYLLLRPSEYRLKVGPCGLSFF